MFFKSKKNIINAQVVKVKTDKIAKRIVRDAKRRIRRGELSDSRSFGMYLSYINAQYDHIIADVDNTTMIADYTAVRAERIAQTGQLLAFYGSNFEELKRLHQDLVEKATAFGKTSNLKNDVTNPPDMTDLKLAFKKLTTEPGAEAPRPIQKQQVRIRM